MLWLVYIAAMNKIVALFCPVKVGDYCQWYSQNTAQWESTRRVVHISRLGFNFFAYFDGSFTAIPVKQLKKE